MSSRTTAPSSWCRSDRLTRVRMKLAESGLPKGGGVGYEIFDKSDTLGATRFVQNINHLRALEGELVRTIKAIDRVQAARVHLVIPERPLFSRDKVEPSASIVLRVRGALEPAQVRAIRHLVASAVNGLKPQRVSIIDESGRLLADGMAAADDSNGASEDRRTAFEQRLREQIESIVSLGRRPRPRARAALGRLRLQPHHRRPSTASIRKAACCARARRARRVLRPRAAKRRSASATNCPARRPPTRIPRHRATIPSKSEEITNYEISRTTKTEVIEGGRIKRISAAVLVDGSYSKNEKGETSYQPRAKEELDRIAALVRTAIGFDQKRGDAVEVVNLRFADAPATPIVEPAGWLSFLQFTKDDIMRAVELCVMGLLGLVVAPVRGAPAGTAHRDAGRGKADRRARRVRAAAGGPHARRDGCEQADGHQRDRQDDRHGAGAGAGARPVDPACRRTRRAQSA